MLVILTVGFCGLLQKVVLRNSRRNSLLDYRVEDLVNVEAGFGGDADDVGGGAAEEIDDFASDFFDVGGGEVDFVDDGDNLEVLFEGEVDIGEGLGLDALGGVDDENGGLDGLEGAGDFVGEIDVAWGVDEVELVAAPVHLDGGEFDGDALFALKFHGVEELGFHLALGDGAGEFHHAVGKGGFAVVDVGDDTEVANMVGVHVL